MSRMYLLERKYLIRLFFCQFLLVCAIQCIVRNNPTFLTFFVTEDVQPKTICSPFRIESNVSLSKYYADCFMGESQSILNIRYGDFCTLDAENNVVQLRRYDLLRSNRVTSINSEIPHVSIQVFGLEFEYGPYGAREKIVTVS